MTSRSVVLKPRGRSWKLAVVALIAVVVALGFFRQRSAANAKRREASYQAGLRSYSATLKPGMSRLDVEAFLTKGGKTFRQQCCIGGTSKNAWDDLVKIGEEDTPWYCSEHIVYIALEFNSSGTQKLPTAGPEDVLTRVSIYRQLEGCL
jgi:hypothetical protein